MVIIRDGVANWSFVRGFSFGIKVPLLIINLNNTSNLNYGFLTSIGVLDHLYLFLNSPGQKHKDQTDNSFENPQTLTTTITAQRIFIIGIMY